MKNWEKYEKEIKEMGLDGVAVTKTTHKMIECDDTPCRDCLFRDEEGDCDSLIIDWLYSDYKEPVVLTDDERKLCELLGGGWIARDGDGVLYYYPEEPTKSKNLKIWEGCNYVPVSELLSQCKFDFIKWEDEEPWEVRV